MLLDPMRALVFSIDDDYVMPFKVLWHSLHETNSIPEATPLYIIHTKSLSERSISGIKSFMDAYSHSPIFCAFERDRHWRLPVSKHVSDATYYRLFLSSLLPEDVTSVVYLDVDTVAVQSLSDLFYMPLFKPIAATDHLSGKDALRLWGTTCAGYFQAGVLIVDLDLWRAMDIEAEFYKILNNDSARILWWDQDVLNMAFRNNWQRLPIWYNCHTLARRTLPQKLVETRSRLFHFDGPTKPWWISSKQPMTAYSSEVWYQAYSRTFSREFKKQKFFRIALGKARTLASKLRNTLQHG
jgi:lipopolysaccharide biosynthesis glycosyltransferase